MTDKTYVLDASAVLAAFFDEPGGEYVADRMSGALLSAVNYSEVVAKLVDRGIPGDQILEIMAQLDVDVVPVDRDQASTAGLLPAPDHALSIAPYYCRGKSGSSAARSTFLNRCKQSGPVRPMAL